MATDPTHGPQRDHIGIDALRRSRRQRLDEGARAQYIADAEEEWRKRTGRPSRMKSSSASCGAIRGRLSRRPSRRRRVLGRVLPLRPGRPSAFVHREHFVDERLVLVVQPAELGPQRGGLRGSSRSRFQVAFDCTPVGEDLLRDAEPGFDDCPSRRRRLGTDQTERRDSASQYAFQPIGARTHRGAVLVDAAQALTFRVSGRCDWHLQNRAQGSIERRATAGPETGPFVEADDRARWHVQRLAQGNVEGQAVESATARRPDGHRSFDDLAPGPRAEDPLAPDRDVIGERARRARGGRQGGEMMRPTSSTSRPAQVEYALRSDESLTEVEVREVMGLYLAARHTGTGRGASKPSGRRTPVAIVIQIPDREATRSHRQLDKSHRGTG